MTGAQSSSYEGGRPDEPAFIANIIRERQRLLRAHRKEIWRDQKQIRKLEAQVNEIRGKVRSLEKELRSVRQREQALRERKIIQIALAVANLFKPFFSLIRWLRARIIRSRPPEVRSDGAPRTGPRPPAIDAEPAAADADIVVCIHNAAEDVVRCLDSVISHTDLDRHHLILVDDGSDSQTQRIANDFANRTDATLIRHETARGYTVSANRGIKTSERPFVVLLNSDAIVGPGWLDHLLECATASPDVGVVGPLSNAASWQSIPELTGPDGSWMVNELPDGVSVRHMAETIARRSPALYPSVPLVNGFCYLISRPALETVGLLDEETFPRGYGEEDDFCIRSLDAGFSHRIADTCYVFHATSRSFTPAGRREIVARSKEVLRERHGPETVENFVEDMRFDEQLVRARGFAAGVARSVGTSTPREDLEGPNLTVGWLQPHLEIAGGTRHAIEMSNRLQAWGATMHLIAPDASPPSWLETTAHVTSLDDARDIPFDVLILSDPDLVEPFLHLEAERRIKYHLGAYMLYRPVNDRLVEYYLPRTNELHLVNSTWTGEQVSLFTGMEIAGVFPAGTDMSQFHPVRTDITHDVVCIGSDRPHKGTHTIERAVGDRSLLRLADHDVPQDELARLINRARVAVSGCWHEGFNLFPLEAMACGVPVVMTDDGGSREYAVHEENALVVEPEDEAAMRAAIERVLGDRELRFHLIGNGLRTAWRYDWDDVSARFAEFLRSAGSDRSGLQ